MVLSLLVQSSKAGASSALAGGQTVKKRVYLAGPEVFFPHAEQAFLALEALCESYGLQGVRPSDGAAPGEGPFEGTPAERAHQIYRANIALLDSCDAVLANLHPFRNHIEPDSGTVFEVGYAVAKGLVVATLVDATFPTYRQRVDHHLGIGRETEDAVYDNTFGYMVESFDKPMNLMLSCSTVHFHEAAEALGYLASALAN